MAWWELLGSALAGGAAKHGFDWLKARGQQQVDARAVLDASLASHLGRLEERAKLLEAKLEAAEKRAVAAEERASEAEKREQRAIAALEEKQTEWDSIAKASQEHMQQREERFAQLLADMQKRFAQMERNALDRVERESHEK